MSQTYILSRKQLNACCRLNSAAVGAYLMAFPSVLNTLPSARPALKAYTELLAQANTLLINANYSLPSDNALTELENLEWLDRDRILFINALLASNQELKTTVDSVAAQMNVSLHGGEDPLGLLAAYDTMAEETDIHATYSIVNDIIESTEISHIEGSSKHPSEIRTDGITLEGTNRLFFQQATELGGLAPAVKKMLLKKITEMGTNDKQALTEEMKKIHLRDLIQSEQDTMIQITTKGHSVSLGKTAGKYWQFNSLDGEYATLCVYENAGDLLEGMLKLVDTAKNGIEFAKIDFELKNEYKPKPAVDPAIEIAEKARIETERNELTRTITQRMGMFQSHQETFELVRTKPLTERYAIYLEQVNMLRTFKTTVEQLVIPQEHHGLISSKEALLENIDAEILKEEKLLNDWEGAHELVQQVHNTQITAPQTLESFESEIETLNMNIQILESMLGSFKTKNPSLEAEINEYLDDSLLNNAIVPLAQAAMTQAKALDSVVFSEDTLPQFFGQITNLNQVMEVVKTHAPRSGQGVYSELEKLRDSINEKMPSESRLKFT